jgi:hypothetical protein
MMKSILRTSWLLLYKVNLNGTVTLVKSRYVRWRKLFARWKLFDDNYDSKPFSYIVPQSFSIKIYSLWQSRKRSKVVNEVPLTEIIPKGFIAVRKGKAWAESR